MDWFYALNGKQVGPVSQEKIIELASLGTVKPEELVWHEGLAEWSPWSVAGIALSSDASFVERAPCAECQQVYSKSDMISLAGNWVCANCKPVVVQRMREGVSPISSGIWRFKKTLVTSLDTTFPERCIKCNQPTSEPQLKRKIYWHHPAVYLALFLNVLIYAILAGFIRKKAIVRISLCPAHRQQRTTALIIGWVCGISGFGALAVGASESTGWLVVLGIVVFLFGIIFAIARGRSIRATKITKENAWVAGCCPAFVAEFPEWIQ